MLLSIVMIVKNEERYLDRTLSSLKTIMREIESELVILDTGSSDRTVEISQKYTEKIYFSKWNDNFAEMRNKSISYCKGDWVLVLDADEEIVECNKMIDFLKSNSKKIYKSASIKLRNFTSENFDRYSDVSIIRMFKNSKSLKYDGAIHEQPVYELPIYNNILECNHYGYMFMDEEIRQKKLARNETILFKELEKDPKQPYINYQLGKNYMSLNRLEDALAYMLESYNLYKDKFNKVPILIQSNLASLYRNMDKFEQCEEVCLKYLQEDDKNIDVYYNLARSQKELRKYKESLKSYERYIYLLENYEISTQANNPFSDGATVSFKDIAKLEIIEIYYILEEYQKVIENLEKIHINDVSSIYNTVLMSLFKLRKYEEILDMYSKECKYDSKKNVLENEIENVIDKLKLEDKKKIYSLFSELDNNYGYLNKVRLEHVSDYKESNRVLIEEDEIYYGDIIYFYYKAYDDIELILNSVENSKIQKYTDYLVDYRKDFIVDLYKYLLDSEITLDIDKLNVYSCISKSLLFKGNLSKEKYKKIFKMYLSYRYDFMKNIYSENFRDENIVKYINNEDDKFIFALKSLNKLKEHNALEYIRKLKTLLLDNKKYKQGIEVLIEEFERDFKLGEDLIILKQEYFRIIEKYIENGNVEESIKMIDEYENIFKEEKLYNFRAIIGLYKNELYKSEQLFKRAYIENIKEDIDLLFNIGYLKELKGEYEEAIKFYEKYLHLCNDNEVKNETISKVENLRLKLNDTDKEIYRKYTKENIENFISNNMIDEAKNQLEIYKSNVEDDISVYSMEGIIYLCEGEIEKAYEVFLNGIKLDNENIDLLYNLAYIQVLLGNREEALENYSKCLKLTDNASLIEEINFKMNEIKMISYTKMENEKVLILNVEEEKTILSNLDIENNKIILLKKNNNIDAEIRYEEKGILVHEINEHFYKSILEDQVRKIECGVVICDNVFEFNFIRSLDSNLKIVYYVNSNKYADEYLNVSKDVYNETQVYNTCDLILTDNIYTYATLKIIGKNNNVYLFNKNIDNVFDINYIIKNYKYIVQNYISKTIEYQLDNIKDEYEKSFYLLSYNDNDLDRSTDVAKNIYEKYGTEDIYRIYISLLIRGKDYYSLVNEVIKSNYCSEDFKLELIYLNILEKYELLEFVANISIKNYSYLNNMSSENMEYKMAICHFELGNYAKSYDKYMSILNKKDYLEKSPMVNKNIGYLMYINRKDEYKLYYSTYQDMLECLY